MLKGASDGSSGRAIAALLGAVALAPLATRALLQAERAGELAVADLRGVVADLAACALTVVVLVVIGRMSRVAAALVGALWVLLQFANYETVRVLGSVAAADDAGYLIDPTFFVGSVLGASRPITALVVLVATLAVLWWRVREPNRTSVLGAVVACILLLAAHWTMPWRSDVESWRQTHVIVHDLETRFRDDGAGPAAGAGTVAGTVAEWVPSLGADLDGVPRIALPGRRANVLLVALESMSGGYLESLAGDHSRSVSASAPQLDAIARQNLSYSSFINHQRKTNRGLYSILCGDLPALVSGEPKMGAYPESGGRECLPRVLLESGYATAYLQAAPLGFMLKGQFMRRVGFADVRGDESLSGSLRNAWGIDDRSFFEQAAVRVRELEAGGAPWFLTLLNVGTHHPFIVPDDWQPDRPEADRAIAYLDDAFGRFYRELDRSGALDDTLVVITSDESLGRTGLLVDPVDRALSQSFGLLVVRVPDAPAPQRVSEPFGSVDLSLSILDYLGLGERGRHWLGRSVFRRYEAPRWLPFANMNLRVTGALDPEGDWRMCWNEHRSCRRFAVPGGRIFGLERSEVAWDAADGTFLRELANRSRVQRRQDVGHRDVPLLDDPDVRVEGEGRHVILGGQYVDLRASDWVEFDLLVDVVSGDGVLSFTHFLRPNLDDSMVRMVQRAEKGQSLRIRYTFRPGGAVEGVSANLLARIVEGERFDLHVQRAALRIRWEGEPPPLRLTIELAEIIPTTPR